MRTLVTGGAGYIGSHLVDALLAQGHAVWVVDDLSTGRMANIEHVLAGEYRRNYRFFADSILNQPLMDELIAGADVVYHLAAVVGVKHVLDDPVRCIAVNIHGTEAVLEIALRYGKRTVIASSSEVYGKSKEVPLQEEGDCLIGPATVPRWSYALTKAVDEQVALALAKRGLPVTVVRYFNSYGPRLHPSGYGSVVARFISQALEGRPITAFGDGQQTRCFTYVDDTVRGTMLAGTEPAAIGRIFNIGSDRATTIVDLARVIRDLAGSKSEIVQVSYREAFGDDFEETRNRVPDVRRAAEILGFRAQVPLEVGLARTVNWFRNGAQ